MAYRTFLYNPTNLKVPKEAPCLGQSKSPNTMQLDRREMMVSSVQIRDMLSRGGVLGLRYTTAIVDGSVLKSRSHTIRLT